MFGNLAGIKYSETVKMLSVQYENIRCLLVCVHLLSCVSERLRILLLSVLNWLLHSPAILHRGAHKFLIFCSCCH